MSTFKGKVEEFPEIAIDYFRQVSGRKPPLACFLSHVHSDHLQGLEEKHRSTLIYCSSTTRRLLLHMEKYVSRMNFANEILERRKRDYRHLKPYLMPLPLDIPTPIQLPPNIWLRVTLLDANHCPGSVMFLIEDESKAILYTGDIRSEPWWVNTLVRNPTMIEFASGLKRLDKIYLDTTFATKSKRYRHFPTKAEGISDLMRQVRMHPRGTTFHFHAWTFGYEEVWKTLSYGLRSQIHVDDYKDLLYGSLIKKSKDNISCPDGAALMGFTFGNHENLGCLTTKMGADVRLDSCEHGTNCQVVASPDTVFITPMITRTEDGVNILELGAGGGGGDLVKPTGIEGLDEETIMQFLGMCIQLISDTPARTNVLGVIAKDLRAHRTLLLEALGLDDNKDIDLNDLIEDYVKLAKKRAEETSKPSDTKQPPHKPPKRIQFPYSRHSSYEELCDLVRALQPNDIYPCTVDEANWFEADSVESLFGEYCSGRVFAHDQEMRASMAERSRSQSLKRRRDSTDSDERRSSRMASHSTSPERYDGKLSIAKAELPEMDDRSDTGSISDLPSTDTPIRNIRRAFSKQWREPLPAKGLRLAGPSHSGVPTVLQLSSRTSPAIDVRQSRTSHGAKGTRQSPIELDDDDDKNEDENTGQDSPITDGNFLLQPMTAPNNLPSSTTRTQSEAEKHFPEPHEMRTADPGSEQEVETQITLSDSAFESQGSTLGRRENSEKRVQRRKEAYKMARGESYSERTDYVLVSSRMGHGIEEVEL